MAVCVADTQMSHFGSAQFVGQLVERLCVGGIQVKCAHKKSSVVRHTTDGQSLISSGDELPATKAVRMR